MPAVAVRVLPGAVIWRHGSSFTHPQIVNVTAADAERLVGCGNCERVRG